MKKRQIVIILRTNYSNFKYSVMFFDLFNTLASLYGYINMILSEKFNVFIVFSLDNIRVYINNANHINSVC